MRSLRTISRPVALLALAAWLGAWSAHVHPAHDAIAGDVAHAHAGLDRLHGEHDRASECAARHDGDAPSRQPGMSSDDAHHEHSSTLASQPILCLSCRSIEEQQLASARAQPLVPIAETPSAPAAASRERGPRRLAGDIPPARGPPAPARPPIA